MDFERAIISSLATEYEAFWLLNKKVDDLMTFIWKTGHICSICERHKTKSYRQTDWYLFQTTDANGDTDELME